VAEASASIYRLFRRRFLAIFRRVIQKRHTGVGPVRGLFTFAAVFAALLGGSAQAANGPLGQPHPWQLGLQDGVTMLKDGLHDFHTLLLIIITAIAVFVMALLVYVMVRFNRTSNPNPSKTSHNTMIEVAWTLVPVLVLIVIAVPSMKRLFEQERIPPADITIKAIGNQWYWSYEYPDNGNFTFDATMIEEKDLKPGQIRLLETANHVVLPVNSNVRVLVTAADVIHSWTVPAFGVKKDAVPGRINELWFNARQEGVYYGQCSELCGALHGFMPIKVEIVSKEKFAAWAADAKKKFASVDAPAPTLAAAAQQ
jgi:cytochrome c oxidase subunit 2